MALVGSDLCHGSLGEAMPSAMTHSSCWSSTIAVTRRRRAASFWSTPAILVRLLISWFRRSKGGLSTRSCASGSPGGS